MGRIPRLVVFAVLIFPIAATRIDPVLGLGVVESESESGSTDSFGKGADQVTFGPGGFDRIPVAGGGIVESEAVVMLRSDDHIFHSGFLGEGGPGLGIVVGSSEILREGLVLGDGDAGVVHDPFPVTLDGLAVILPGGHGVDAPMDKHPKAGLLEPFQPLGLLFRRFAGETFDGG